ncbi:MAG TPA: hypothetical protein VM734_28490 [Kofleriaceae bacterium]|nr:hypothetical protein [Kofleriaceae bacterium]
MPTNSYDLIVLGDDLAGLVAATLCARRGLRTLVLGREDRPARYALGPLRLPVEPGILPGRGAGAAARVIRELGLDHALKRKVRDVRVTAQLVAPDVRIDLATESAMQLRELEREVPGEAEAITGVWTDAAEVARAADAVLDGDDAFPGVGFFERRDVAKQTVRLAETAAAWWAKVEAISPGAAALTRLPAAVGGRAVDPPPVAIARALDLWRQGAPSIRGDGTGLRELLLEKLQAAGGELRVAAVTELVQGWSKISAVKLASGEELGAGQVIAAMPAVELVALFGKKPPKRLVEIAGAAKVLGWRYVLNVVIDAAGVPEGMAPIVLYVADGDLPLAGANAFTIHVAEPDDQGRAVVTLATVLPAEGDGAPATPAVGELAGRTARLRAGLLEQLEQVMPFAQDHLVLAHSPHEDTPPVAPGGRGTYDVGRGLPAAMSAVFAGTLEGSAGLAAAPYGSGVKNLTLASAQVLPTLGLEGDLVVGWSAAREACGIAGKKRDYLRDEVVSNA